MENKQCWEVKKCGRQPGGEKVDKRGICPAALPTEYDGLNGGKNACRFCWAIAGTLCDGELQGIYTEKIENCLSCKFLQQVQKEESKNFILTPQHATTMQELKKLISDVQTK